MADKIKKLSEAIRLGATFRPQCHGSLFQNVMVGEEVVVGSCALGAASEAIGTDKSGGSIMSALHKRFPELLTMVIRTDQSNGRESLVRTIIFLNDKQHWTREQIASLLESVGL